MYFDGSFACSNPDITSDLTNDWPLQIGARSTTAIDGSIDDVRIYNRALSAAEIYALYSAGR